MPHLQSRGRGKLLQSEPPTCSGGFARATTIGLVNVGGALLHSMGCLLAPCTQFCSHATRTGKGCATGCGGPAASRVCLGPCQRAQKLVNNRCATNRTGGFLGISTLLIIVVRVGDIKYTKFFTFEILVNRITGFHTPPFEEALVSQGPPKRTGSCRRR